MAWFQTRTRPLPSSSRMPSEESPEDLLKGRLLLLDLGDLGGVAEGDGQPRGQGGEQLEVLAAEPHARARLAVAVVAQVAEDDHPRWRPWATRGATSSSRQPSGAWPGRPTTGPVPWPSRARAARSGGSAGPKRKPSGPWMAPNGRPAPWANSRWASSAPNSRATLGRTLGSTSSSTSEDAKAWPTSYRCWNRSRSCICRSAER